MAKYRIISHLLSIKKKREGGNLGLIFPFSLKQLKMYTVMESRQKWNNLFGDKVKVKANGKMIA